MISQYYPWTLQRRSRRLAFVCRCTKHLNPLGLASLFVQSRDYQMSVTLPANVIEPLLLWIRMVSALATWMSTTWEPSMNTMWCPGVELAPLVMAAPDVDSKPTHSMKVLGI